MYLEFLDQLNSGRWSEANVADDAADAGRTSLLDNLPQHVHAAFELTRPFALKDWMQAKQVWPLLRDGNPLPVNPPVGLRHLMNAAWYALLADYAPAPRLPAAEIERTTLVAAMDVVRPPTDVSVPPRYGSVKSSLRG